MKHGVLFEINGDKVHSSDWDIVLSNFEVAFAEPKTDYVNIEGADGSLDLTEVYGKVFYQNRTHKMTFTCKDELRYDSTLNAIVSFLHGRVAKVTPYFDEDYYYYGRLSVNRYLSSRTLGTIEIAINSEPYKYKQDETTVIKAVSGNTIVHYLNDTMDVMPTFEASTPITFTYKGNAYTLGTNKTQFTNIIFTKGDNYIEYHGEAIVKVTYQEGTL